MTETSSEAAKVNNGKFIGSYNPSDEKAEVDPTSGPEAKDSDLFGSMFYLLNLPVGFLPSDHFLHVAKDTVLGYVAPPWSLCLEKERGSLIKIWTWKPHMGTELPQLGSLVHCLDWSRGQELENPDRQPPSPAAMSRGFILLSEEEEVWTDQSQRESTEQKWSGRRQKEKENTIFPYYHV